MSTPFRKIGKTVRVEAESYDIMKFLILSRAGKILEEHPESLTIRAKAFGFGVANFLLKKYRAPRRGS